MKILKLGVWQFSTNGVMTKDVFDISTIGFGPGLEEHAHTVQDQVKEADLAKAQEFYAGRYVIYLRLSGERYSFMIIK